MNEALFVVLEELVLEVKESIVYANLTQSHISNYSFIRMWS